MIDHATVYAVDALLARMGQVILAEYLDRLDCLHHDQGNNARRESLEWPKEPATWADSF